jgi:thymidylate kinase
MVVPKLREGMVVISSRYFDSSRVLQGMVRGIGEYVENFARIEQNQYLHCRPDVTYFLDASSSTCLQRVTLREEAPDKLDKDFTNPSINIGKVWKDYFSTVLYHPSVMHGSKKIKFINAEQAIELVQADLLDCVESTLHTFNDRAALHKSFLQGVRKYF